MNDTPRTDEFVAGLSVNEYEFGEAIRYAKTLERELAAAKASLLAHEAQPAAEALAVITVELAAVKRERESIVAEANQRIEGLEISVEAAKANATCIAKALGDVTEEKEVLMHALDESRRLQEGVYRLYQP